MTTTNSNSTANMTTQKSDIMNGFRRLRTYPATNSPLVRAQFETKEGKKTYAAEWGLDSNQDVSRAGIIIEGPFEGYQWMMIGDGHGELSSIPKWLRELPNSDIETCMSTNNPGVMLEQLLAETDSNIGKDSGACIVLCRISPMGEIELWNAGDSRGMVLAQLPNEDKVSILLKTVEHNAENASELHRLLKEKYPDVVVSSNATCSELQDIALSCGLLTIDKNMLLPLEGSERPRATMGPGFRVDYSITEKDYQMTRSIGHKPLGITGINWDYFHTKVPNGAKVHVVLSSDGLWDVEPSKEELFAWCEQGGDAMIYQIANRWICDWDYEHPWEHNCQACRERRISFLDSVCKETYPDAVRQLKEELNTHIYKTKDQAIKDISRQKLKELSLIKTPFVPLHDRIHIKPPIPYNGHFVRTIQNGLKPDDLSLAICSWIANTI